MRSCAGELLEDGGEAERGHLVADARSVRRLRVPLKHARRHKAAARRIDLPPFLATLLGEVMDSHDHAQVFCTVEGHWHRRSHFSRRIWRPACDGEADRGWSPVAPGAVFNGLRHHHKTTLDELHVEEVLKYERMGHHMPGIGGVYSHVTTAMRHRLRRSLQHRWTKQTPA